jgi:hypothetical protein
MKSRRLRLKNHVPFMEEVKSADINLFRKYRGKRSLVRLRRKCDKNIETSLRKAEQ